MMMMMMMMMMIMQIKMNKDMLIIPGLYELLLFSLFFLYYLSLASGNKKFASSLEAQLVSVIIFLQSKIKKSI